MKTMTRFQQPLLARELFFALCVFSFNVANAGAPTVPTQDMNEALPDVSSSREYVSKKPPKSKVRIRDPLKVEPSLAVKETPAKEIVLPGVMKLAGENVQALDFTSARVISLNNGGSQTVYLSVTEPNRIQLPFSNPRIIGTTDLVIEKTATSNNVYIGFKSDVAYPVQVFMEGPDGGPVLGLQLVPKIIQSQTIIVQDDTPAASPEQRRASKSSEYITSLQSLAETVALGSIPNGYSTVDEDLPVIVMNGLMVDVYRRYSNREGDIYVYTVTNSNQAQATVRESEFDGDTVLAVSIFPKPVLASGEKTQVIVITRKVRGH